MNRNMSPVYVGKFTSSLWSSVYDWDYRDIGWYECFLLHQKVETRDGDMQKFRDVVAEVPDCQPYILSEEPGD